MPRLRVIAAAVMFLGTSLSLAAEGVVAPPPGFQALFNGEDLAGWHAINFHQIKLSPTEFDALPEDDRRKLLQDAWKEATKHWTVENGELVNDGDGPYLTTDHSFGDIELLIEYKTVPLADSGIYLRDTPQVQIWDYDRIRWQMGSTGEQGIRRTVEQSAGAAGQRPAGAGRQGPSASGTAFAFCRSVRGRASG